ncbi:hypothetical protein MBLNU230_g2201t1 [Neophaeotheca triangularis]
MSTPHQTTMDAPPSSDATTLSSPAPKLSQEQSQPTTAPSSTAALPPASNPRLQALASKKATLEQKLHDLQTQRAEAVAKATLPSGLAMPEDWSEEQKSKQAFATANGLIKEHIALLHRYNEVKDIGLGLMGMVAEKRSVKQAEVMEEFGVGEKD